MKLNAPVFVTSPDATGFFAGINGQLQSLYLPAVLKETLLLERVHGVFSGCQAMESWL